MPIDWSTTGTWMQAWAGFAQAAVVVYAARKAANTYEAWRRQKIEERRIDVAERLLTLSYKMKRAFSVIRCPTTTRVAIEEATIKLIESGINLEEMPQTKRRKVVEAQVVFDRINSFSEDWNEISVVSPIASALLGQDIESILAEFWHQRVAVEVAGQNYPDDDKSDPVFTSEIAHTLWECRDRQPHKADRVGMKIAETIVALEKRLMPIIRSTS